MRKLLVVGLGAVCLLLEVPTVSAHLELTNPPARYARNQQKNPPCGMADGPRGDNLTVYEPGETIEVVWEEFVNHPGHFRIAFDEDGSDDFVDPPCMENCESRTNPTMPVFEYYSNSNVLLDNIEDNPSGGIYRATVTLPNVQCENCTLQVIQVMYDKRPISYPGNDLYYQCANIALRGEVMQDAMPMEDAAVDAAAEDASVPDGSVPDGEATTPDARVPPEASTGGDDDVSGGCAVTPGPATFPLGAVAIAFWLGVLSRRRRS
ncbi:MAG: SCE4755 family polysaccharide monooxygenase-like protein [Myxococcota bacterium]